MTLCNKAIGGNSPDFSFKLQTFLKGKKEVFEWNEDMEKRKGEETMTTSLWKPQKTTWTSSMHQQPHSKISLTQSRMQSSINGFENWMWQMKSFFVSVIRDDSTTPYYCNNHTRSSVIANNTFLLTNSVVFSRWGGGSCVQALEVCPTLNHFLVSWKALCCWLTFACASCSWSEMA